MPIHEALVADFREEVAGTRKMLEAIPEDGLGWKPHEKSMSLGRLAGHIAETPAWVRAVMEDDLDFAAAGGDYQPYAATSCTHLLETFEKNVAGLEKAIAGRSDEFLSATWTVRHGEKVIMSMPRHAAIRTIAIHHLVHHRGQLSVYLRLLGAAVPTTYGPTADHPDAF